MGTKIRRLKSGGGKHTDMVIPDRKPSYLGMEGMSSASDKSDIE